mmetsp:Transcript_23353/g.54304  ORF Transcript_23353/g.54304 Transcript_23353/m.54304 type:complete len:625 (+) Transcript_23353:39-1913(+)
MLSSNAVLHIGILAGGAGLYLLFVKERSIGWNPHAKDSNAEKREDCHRKTERCVYDIGDLKAPHMVGYPLRLFSMLNYVPLLGDVLRMHLLKVQGFIKVRKFTLSLADDCPPTLHPVAKLHDDTMDEHNELAKAYGVDWVGSLQTQSKPHLGSLELQQAYRAGKATPSAVVEATLDAIRDNMSSGAPFRAFTQCNEQDARAQAEASTRRWASLKPLGPLDGVPVAVKETVDVKGYFNNQGTRFLAGITGRSERDCISVARLKQAGAIIVGMTCMHEIGMGVSGCNIQDGGAHRNPHSLGHYAGGSSSGSASAVASGIVPIAVGADGGGSIRIPAGLCGVYGIKPSFARVPDRPDHTVAQCGPIAGTIRDTCLAYLVMSGPDASLPVSRNLPSPHVIGFDQTNSLKGVKVGVYRDYFDHSSPEIREAGWRMVRGIEAMGGEVQEIEIANLDAMRLAHLIIINSEVNTEMDRYFSSDMSLFQIDNQLILSVTRQLSARDYLSALKVRTHAMRVMSRLFETIDVIALPTTAITAPRVGKGAELFGESNLPALGRVARYAFLGNLCGLPGMNIPAGKDSEGLPIGFQLMGGHCREDVILRVANALDHGGYAVQTRPLNYYTNVETLIK